MANPTIAKTGYDNFVYQFKVNGSTNAVGVQAVAIDDALVDSAVSTDLTKLISSGAVKTYVDTEVAKAGKVEIKVLSAGEDLPTASASTLGYIYLKPKTPKGYTEHVTVKGGTDEAPTYTWEEIGDTDVDLSEYIKTADADAKYVAKEPDKSLVSDTDITKLGNIEAEATKVEVDATNKTIKHGSDTITVPDATTITDNSTTGGKTITVGSTSAEIKPAYDTIGILNTSGKEVSKAQAKNGTQFNFMPGNDKITITTATDIAGNPTIKIAATGEVTVEPAEQKVQGIMYLPTYSNGTIDMTNVAH